MPMERTRRGRVLQVARWLGQHYPPAYPTRVAFADLKRQGGHYGECKYGRRRLTITIHSRLPWHHAIEVLLHEWAHAHTWRLGEPNDHGPLWGTTYGLIYSAFYDLGGAEASREC